MGKHLAEILEKDEIDYRTEQNRLLSLFCEKVDPSLGTSLFCFFYEYFSTLPADVFYNYDDLNDLFLAINAFKIGTITLDDFCLLIELIETLFLTQESPRTGMGMQQAFQSLILTYYNHCAARFQVKDYIKYILDKLNCEEQVQDGYVFVVQKNAAATQAAKLCKDSNIEREITEYNRISLKGNLREKRAILVSLGSYIEPILKAHTLRDGGYGTLESDVGFLLNNFDIRHNNKVGKNQNAYVAALTDEELEEWYDRTYHSILMVLLAKEQIGISSQLKEAKAHF